MNVPLNDFQSAGKAVLAYLHERFGFGLWMLTRAAGEDWIVLQAEDHAYGVSAGATFRWADTFCYQMVRGNGPRVAPDSTRVPAYAAAEIGRQFPIKAYVGVPLTNADGSTFGTLCAIDPARQPAAVASEQPQIELLAALLSTILQTELRVEQESRRSERLAAEANSDTLTQLANRRAWDQALAREEERCRRYGPSAAVMAIDVNGLKQVNDTEGHAAGDALIVRAAQALRQSARNADLVARLGGDEFGILAVECAEDGAQALVSRTRRSLAIHDVRASLGIALRNPANTLSAAWELADNRMYEDKRLSKAERAS